MEFRARVIFSIATALLFVASSVSATMNPPRSAKKIRMDLVRAYSECTGSPLDTTIPPIVIPACNPSAPTPSLLEFGPKGAGFVQLSVGRGPDLKIKIKLKDVRDSGTHMPVTGTNLIYVTAGTRLTTTGCTSGPDCTEIDQAPGSFPNIMAFDCTAGTCKGTKSVNVTYPVMPKIVTAGHKANVEITPIQVLDGGLNLFLVPGIYIP